MLIPVTQPPMQYSCRKVSKSRSDNSLVTRWAPSSMERTVRALAFFLAAGILLLAQYLVCFHSFHPTADIPEELAIVPNKADKPLTTIRSWGCNLTTLPFIFVHIGKAGGGTIRHSLAAATNGHDDWQRRHESRTTLHFRSSSIPQQLIWHEPSFEKTELCMATTPVGKLHCRTNSPPPSTNLVYVGHNAIGSELHWLFNASSWQVPSWMHEIDLYNDTAIAQASPPSPYAYGSIYASLPVLRVTVLREPFSWLLSKYFWHKMHKTPYTCTDVENATRRQHGQHYYLDTDVQRYATPGRTRNKYRQVGWARRMALTYVLYLCGDDCLARLVYNDSQDVFDQIVDQAEYNLRHSFAVVGLLNETDTFVDMIRQRVAYMGNLTTNADVVHMGRRYPEYDHCHEVYHQRPRFRQRLLKTPEIAAMMRLWKVAIEVNAFQQEELTKCAA